MPSACYCWRRHKLPMVRILRCGPYVISAKPTHWHILCENEPPLRCIICPREIMKVQGIGRLAAGWRPLATALATRLIPWCSLVISRIPLIDRRDVHADHVVIVTWRALLTSHCWRHRVTCAALWWRLFPAKHVDGGRGGRATVV